MNNMNIAQELKSLRESRGLTLRAAEELTSVPYTHLCKIENGKTSPTIEVLERILKAYGHKLVIQEE